MTNKRPDMRDYFRARIDWHVNGLFSRTAHLPSGVMRVSGDVTDDTIIVTMRDGSTWKWEGGRYSTRKINGCYAPLMPRITRGNRE